MVGEVETISDMGLRAAVRAHLRDAPGDASPERLDELIVDEASALDGIEHFSGLRQIGLEGTLVVDLQPLAGLRNLRQLWLSDTRVMDLRPLSGLHELTVLELGDTPVADIEPLRPLHHLQKLWLNGTKVTDLAPIRSLKGLLTLGLVGAPIQDYRPLESLDDLQVLVVSRSAAGSLGTLPARSGLDIFLSDE
ncbi:leucine-rich repeat domain-containing protein [Curtobacterium sp. csp3]|uniref:leucine-rich repeat domain-containing protein n=1 Tax=Curtobacterium sp. csp3 TaxID=2588937 RepID=UPI00159A0202|nr:leucine-rich repeat domain-containing protein [Curtobacterium sp. csp3]QKS12666.1 leucine-rich repeat domain-containing protein [Curtobacterium sp. csp3]